MLFEFLRKVLRAVSAELVSERDLFSLPDENVLRPETFNMTLEKVVSMDSVLEVVERICLESGSKMKVLECRKEDMNIPSRAIILITSGKIQFKSIVLVENLFVSFLALP